MKLKDITVLPMMEKEYEALGFKAIPIPNYTEWHKWMEKYSGTLNIQTFNKMASITGDNRKKFRKHFGPRCFAFKGSHFFHAWLININSQTLVLILTAKDHGTCYEVVEYRNQIKLQNDISKVLEFMDFVADLS